MPSTLLRTGKNLQQRGIEVHEDVPRSRWGSHILSPFRSRTSRGYGSKLRLHREPELGPNPECSVPHSVGLADTRPVANLRLELTPQRRVAGHGAWGIRLPWQKGVYVVHNQHTARSEQ